MAIAATTEAATVADEAAISKRERRKRRDSAADKSQLSRKESMSAAVVRALVGTLAFVFRAPVRLFRPVKLSSWNLLEAMAKREGRTLSFRYMRTLLQREKSTFLPHLLIPPLLVNTTIGFCLFEAYSLTESHLLERVYPKKETAPAAHTLLPSASASPGFTPLWIVAVAGVSAGAAQCIVSAPLDNVRIILSSQKSKHKVHSHPSHLRHPLGISWRAVVRAALLPFAPEVTRNRLVDEVRKSGQAGDSVGGKGTRRLLWEKRIKRWRGGVHGAGLIMSLARDSVGFSAFFVVFEISRRVAFSTSLKIDQLLAFWNTSAVLPGPQNQRRDVGEDEEQDYRSESLTPGDFSFSQSRTKTGRFFAALVLIIGGAMGAALYEVVGRPAELMRIVIWEGRKAWEEGRRGTKKEALRQQLGRTYVTGARKRPMQLLYSTSGASRSNRFLSLRSGNRGGSVLSRVQALSLQRASTATHPLTLGIGRHLPFAQRPVKLEIVATERPSRKQRNVFRVKRSRVAAGIVSPSTPNLSTRPSAYTLLLEHAQKTSILRYTSAKNQRHHFHPTPVPTHILLFHTYFIAPFSTHQPPVSQSPHSNAEQSSTKKAPSLKRTSFLASIFRFKYPLSNAPGSVKGVTEAQVWGTGRLAWALRRLASPYAVGFLAFAWMSGDLAA